MKYWKDGFWCEVCEKWIEGWEHDCPSFGKPHDPEAPLSDQG